MYKRQRYDISYGVYIYAWPVQQFLTLVTGPDFPIVLDLLIVFAVTVPIAFASCVLIERPFLARKARVETPVTRGTAGSTSSPLLQDASFR